MKTHTLAKLLLEGPDVLVVKPGHEPNDDTHDEIDTVEAREVYQVDYGRGFHTELHDMKPRNAELPVRAVAVVVLR